jgi:glycosyltransferase involved in cell wall biosynthesis
MTRRPDTPAGEPRGRIRVAVVARSVHPLHGHGGLERHVYDLVRHLAGAGVDVTLITRRAASGTPDPAASIDARITVRMVPYRTFPLAGRRGTTILDRSTAYPLFGERAGRLAWELVQAGQIDVVHGLGASVLGYARRRWRSTAPLILNPQGLEEFGATDPARARLKRIGYLPLRRAVLACARAADRVIATDRSLEPAVLRHLRVPRDRVRVIPNALDLEWIDTLAAPGDGLRVRQAAGLGRGDLALVSVGRMEENKGLHVLADALAALREHPASVLEGPWRWIVVGDGPFRSRLEARIRALDLTAHVLLTGRLPERDLHAWYEAATLFVHPTLYEGSSLVTLEAMAHRRAVVATSAGGLPDKVAHGVTGWLVRPGDASGLAAAINGALGERSRLAGMGAEGRRLVEREFSWNAAGPATIRLYEEVLVRGSSERQR